MILSPCSISLRFPNSMNSFITETDLSFFESTPFILAPTTDDLLFISASVSIYGEIPSIFLSSLRLSSTCFQF